MAIMALQSQPDPESQPEQLVALYDTMNKSILKSRNPANSLWRTLKRAMIPAEAKLVRSQAEKDG
ncbi:MAG: hypothetical protein RMJ19_10665 [Gemmatales bacterium]|nr:hypothetical protein [Gemmatales bacterium]MDW8176123.1 hypothetical protein [Gemmatales bacterium]